MVNVSSISSRWEHTVYKPAKLGAIGCPFGASSVWSTIRILFAAWNCEEQKFMGTANRSNIRSVLTPINWDNEGVVLATFAYKTVVSSLIDIDYVVMRSNSKHTTIWRILNSFNPLFWVSVCSNNVVKLINSSSDGQCAIIVSDCNMSVWTVVINSTCALRVRERSQRRSTSSL